MSRAASSIARAVFDFDRNRLPRVFYFIATTSAAVLVISIVRWQLVKVLTVFIEPVLEIVAFGLFAAGLVWTIVHATFPVRGIRPNRFSPLLVGLGTLAIILFVPFDWILTKVDFAVNMHSRTVVAQRLLAEKSPGAPMDAGRGDLVHLAGWEHRLSDDGDVMVWHTAQQQMVFFFTFRGILDSFSGFVYSANDSPPAREEFGGEWIEVEHLRKNWYWAASRN